MFPPGRAVNANFETHLGISYIQAYLAKHGFTSKQVLPPQGSTLDDCAKRLIATNAKIIGFTCYDSNYFLVRAISSLIKRARPKCIIIAGGPTATFSDQLLLTNVKDIDLCVRFEGEETTLELMSLDNDGRLIDNLEEIAGITFRDKKSVIRTSERQLFGSRNGSDCGLDGLPSPYLEGFLNGSEGAGVISARGCVHYCTYCNFATMSKHTIRYHSVERIISELRHIAEALESTTSKSINQEVRFNDDAFTLNVRRAKEICRRIIDEEIKLKLSCLCRADNLDCEFVELLHDAGFYNITFGVESSVPRVLRTIKKVRTNDQLDRGDHAPEKRFISRMIEGIAFAKSQKMATSVSIILGLPGETVEDGLKTIDFIRDLDVDHYNHNYLQLFPGTELFGNAKDYNIKVEPSSFKLPYVTKHAYPVHEIPFLENSSLKSDERYSGRIVLKALTGGPYISKSVCNGVALAIVEKSEGNKYLASFGWLSLALAVQGGVIILGEQEDNIDNFDSMMTGSYNLNFPSNEFYYLKSKPFSDADLIYEIINKPLHGQLLQWNPRFPLIQFSKSLKFAENHDHMQDRLFPVFCLNDKADVKFLAEFADILTKQVSKGIIGSKVWLDGVFLDGCRWGLGLCPALKLPRVFINKQNEILPCMTGKPLGNLQDSAKDLRDNAKKIYTSIREERKCDECPIDSRCSKCLFPYPLDQQEYCELQRENLNISGIVTRSNLVNTIELGQ